MATMTTGRRRRAAALGMYRKRAPVCATTGEIGCMDCVEGLCEGGEAWTLVTFCKCGGNDLYGEMHHNPGCAHYNAAAEGRA